MTKFLYIVLNSMFLFSCKKEKDNVALKNQTTQKEIVVKNTIEGYWQLQKVDDKIFDIDKIIGYNQDQPTMIINLKEKTVKGFSGCNSYGGNLKTESFNLNFSNIVATEMGCNINAWEIDYYRRLSEIQKFEFMGNDLKVFGRKGETMLFKKKNSETFRKRTLGTFSH